MNRLTEEFHGLLRPEAALIAYRCEKPQRKTIWRRARSPKTAKWAKAGPYPMSS